MSSESTDTKHSMSSSDGNDMISSSNEGFYEVSNELKIHDQPRERFVDCATGITKMMISKTSSQLYFTFTRALQIYCQKTKGKFPFIREEKYPKKFLKFSS